MHPSQSSLADRLKLAKSRHRLAAVTLADKAPNQASSAETLDSASAPNRSNAATAPTTAANATKSSPSLSVYERRIKQAAQFSMGSPVAATSTLPGNTGGPNAHKTQLDAAAPAPTLAKRNDATAAVTLDTSTTLGSSESSFRIGFGFGTSTIRTVQRKSSAQQQPWWCRDDYGHGLCNETNVVVVAQEFCKVFICDGRGWSMAKYARAGAVVQFDGFEKE
jgi:hypothetical protein